LKLHNLKNAYKHELHYLNPGPNAEVYAVTCMPSHVTDIFNMAVAMEPSRRFHYFAATEPSRTDGSVAE